MPRNLPGIFIIDDGMIAVFIDLVDNVIKLDCRIVEVNQESFVMKRSFFRVEMKSIYRSKVFIEEDAKNSPDISVVAVSTFDLNDRHDEYVWVI